MVRSECGLLTWNRSEITGHALTRLGSSHTQPQLIPEVTQASHLIFGRCRPSSRRIAFLAEPCNQFGCHRTGQSFSGHLSSKCTRHAVDGIELVLGRWRGGFGSAACRPGRPG